MKNMITLLLFFLSSVAFADRPCGIGSSPGCRIIWERVTITPDTEATISQVIHPEAQKKSHIKDLPFTRGHAGIRIPLVVTKANTFFNVYAIHSFYIRNDSGYQHNYQIEARLKVMAKEMKYEAMVDLVPNGLYLEDYHSTLWGLKIPTPGEYGIWGSTSTGSPELHQTSYTARLVIQP